MPTFTFVVLDTNILFRVVTQGQPGCECEHWDELKAFVNDKSITLLVPEVVLLEFDNKVRNLKDDFAGKMGAVVERVIAESRKNLWNELGDLPSFLEIQLNEWKRNKITEAESRREEIQRFLGSAEVIRIPFDLTIMIRSKKRMMAGRVKVSRDRADADCFIVESLVRYFEKQKGKSQLLLCTENDKEFGVETKEGKKTLHPLMKEGLPPTELFTDLASLVTFVEERKAVEEPSPEEVDEALERDKAEEIELEEAVLEAMTPIPSLPLGSQDMADAIRAKLARTIDPSYLRAVTPDMSQLRATQEAVAKMMEPFRQQQEAVAKMMEPLRQQQEAAARMIEPLRQQQEAVAKMMEPLRQQLEALSNVMASLSERIGPAGACGAGL